MGDILTWEALNGDEQAGPAEEAGQADGGDRGAEPLGGPVGGAEGAAEAEAEAAEAAERGEGGPGPESGWELRTAVDARAGEQAEGERVVLLDEFTYAELAGSAEAFTQAQVHAQKIQSDDLREAALCGIEVARAVCAAVRSAR